MFNSQRGATLVELSLILSPLVLFVTSLLAVSLFCVRETQLQGEFRRALFALAKSDFSTSSAQYSLNADRCSLYAEIIERKLSRFTKNSKDFHVSFREVNLNGLKLQGVYVKQSDRPSIRNLFSSKINLEGSVLLEGNIPINCN